VPLVVYWCRRAGLRSEDAADVVQDVFRAVSEGIAGFHYGGPNDTFRGWLRKIAQNKIRDYFRAQAKRPQAVGGSDAYQRFMEVCGTSSPNAADSGVISALIKRAVERVRVEFAQTTWRAFWLATVDNLSSAEVGHELGMSTGAVRQAKYKVLRRLRQELGDAE